MENQSSKNRLKDKDESDGLRTNVYHFIDVSMGNNCMHREDHSGRIL